jgi:ribonuclease/clavin/mitogillin
MCAHLRGSLYEAALRRMSSGAAASAPPPRPSAAVIPWRRNGDGIEVYWVKRSETLPFMGGWHAFPGGAASRSDAALPVAGEPRGWSERAGGVGFAKDGAEESGPDLPPGTVATALRELYEETGLLVARYAGAPPSPERLAADRVEIEKQKTLADVLASLGATLDASRLVWAGRWLTPRFAPTRFDNRFFLLEWPESEPVQPEVLPGELESGEWIAPEAAWQSWKRGEVLAAPPILHILDVLRHHGPEAGQPKLADTSDAYLGPLRRIEMRPGVLMFPLRTFTLPPAATTNAYLLGTGDAVLIDPGSPHDDENDRLLAALAAAEERLGRRVTAIWLTHHHQDHVSGVERIRKALNVPVLAHRETAERLRGGFLRRGIEVDGFLEDGQRVVLADGGSGFPVRVVFTPGHARGHLAFFEEAGGSLLAGDLVAGIGTIVIDPPEGDMDAYLASLDKAGALLPKTLFPAHGPAVKDAGGYLAQYAEHRLWREAKVAEAWKEGKRTPAEMLPTVYADVAKEAHPIAERQILAHLERLKSRGELAP